MAIEPTFPGCLIEYRPIGLFKIYDEKGTDAGLLCVPARNPILHDSQIRFIHIMKEMRNSQAYHYEISSEFD